MKYTNEISCQGNDNDYHFKGMFSLFFLNGFVFLAKLDKPNEFERSLACDVCFVCASQKTSHAQKKLVVCFSCPIRNMYAY